MLEALKTENVRFHILPITEKLMASDVYTTNCPDITYLEEYQSSTGVTVARKRRNEERLYYNREKQVNHAVDLLHGEKQY